MPVIDGKPISFEDLHKSVAEESFSEKKFATLQSKYSELKIKLDSILSKGREIERDLKQKVEKSIQEFGLPHIEELLKDIREKYQNEAVDIYLDEIRDYTLDEIHIFFKNDDSSQQTLQSLGVTSASKDVFRIYKVNLLADNSHRKHAPAIVETAPNYKNLFGTIEKVTDQHGNWASDFLNIKAGSFLRAEGGYLVINLLEAIGEPFVWQTLKRTLKYRQLEIESPETHYVLGQTALKPEPIQLDLKVVLIGDKQHYLMLYNRDEDFKKIFKISADFNDKMDRTKRNILDYACFIDQLTKREKLLPFDASGVAAIVEESIRMADRQDKLSSKFSDIADLVREATYWARTKKTQNS